MTNTSSATASTVTTPVDLIMESSAATPISAPSSLATSASPSVQLGTSDGLSTRLALRQRFVKTRPLYVNSFGESVFQRSTRSGLNIIGWRVTSKVQQIWGLLEPSLTSLIKDKRQALELLRPSGAIWTPGYALRCFLMGSDKDHATPYVAILCGTSWLCKGIGKLIMDSGLLVADGFRCCGLPDKPELYGRKASDGSDESGEDLKVQDHNLFEGSATNAGNTSITAMATLDGFQMYYTSPRGFLNGREVEVCYNGSPIGRSTVGGIIEVGSERFEMTVRHVFSQPNPHGDVSADWGSTGEDDLEVDMFDSDDDDDLEQDEDEIRELPERVVISKVGQSSTSGGSDDEIEMDLKSHFREPIPVPQESHTGAGRSDSDDDNRLESTHLKGTTNAFESDPPIISTEKPILAAPNQKLDWALRKIRMDLPPDSENDPSGNENVYFVAPAPTSSQNTVVLKTPFNTKHGSLESSGVLVIPFDGFPQPVQVVSIPPVQLRPGECGSWAMQAADKTFVGMVVGSCPTLGEVYILRMSDILDDIHDQTGLPVKVAPTIQPPNEEVKAPKKHERAKEIEIQFQSALQNLLFQTNTTFGAPEAKMSAELKKRRHEVEDNEEDEEGCQKRESSQGASN